MIADRRPPLILAENLRRHYLVGTETVRALDDVSFAIGPGEFVAIIGPSGSGKSTMMNLLGALDIPTSGRLLFDNQDLAGLGNEDLAEIRNEKIGFIFQQFNLLPRTSALRQVLLPLSYSRTSNSRSGHMELARSMLAKVGLADRMQYLPSQLSGGQQQRIAIARALVNSPQLLLADEPTGALDSVTSGEIMGLLRSLNRQGLTIVVVTHDPDVAAQAHRVIKFRDGKIETDERPSMPILEVVS